MATNTIRLPIPSGWEHIEADELFLFGPQYGSFKQYIEDGSGYKYSTISGTINDSYYWNKVEVGDWIVPGDTTSGGDIHNSASTVWGWGGQGIKFKFTGTKFRLIGWGTSETTRSKNVEVYIDNNYVSLIENPLGSNKDEKVIYESNTLSYGTHYIEILNNSHKYLTLWRIETLSSNSLTTWDNPLHKKLLSIENNTWKRYEPNTEEISYSFADIWNSKTKTYDHTAQWSIVSNSGRYAFTNSKAAKLPARTISANAKFNFFGTKLAIIGTAFGDLSNSTHIYIDGIDKGILRENFNSYSYWSSITGTNEYNMLDAMCIFYIDNLLEDEHTVELRNYSDTASFYLDAIDINIAGELRLYGTTFPRIITESINDNIQISSNYNISGYALAGNGVKTVEVYLNDIKLANAIYKQPREDIYNLYPDYNNHNSGWSYILNTYDMNNGIYTIQIKMTLLTGTIKYSPIYSVIILNQYTKHLLATTHNNITSLLSWDGSNWVTKYTGINSMPTHEKFIKSGFENISYIPNYALQQLTNTSYRLHTYRYGYGNEDIQLKLSYIPIPSVVIAKEDIALHNVSSINNISIQNNTTGASIIKMIVSTDNGLSWLTYYNNAWSAITINNLNDIKIKGISVSNVHTMNSYHWNQLLDYLTPNMGIRFAFYLEQNNIDDILQLNSVIATIDTVKKWKSLSNGIDYTYSYDSIDKKINLQLNTDGNIKVNYSSLGQQENTTIFTFTDKDINSIEDNNLSIINGNLSLASISYSNNIIMTNNGLVGDVTEFELDIDKTINIDSIEVI